MAFVAALFPRCHVFRVMNPREKFFTRFILALTEMTNRWRRHVPTPGAHAPAAEATPTRNKGHITVLLMIRKEGRRCCRHFTMKSVCCRHFNWLWIPAIRWLPFIAVWKIFTPQPSKEQPRHLKSHHPYVSAHFLKSALELHQHITVRCKAPRDIREIVLSVDNIPSLLSQ